MKLLTNNNLPVAALWGASLSLTFFWIINILKEAYPSFKSFLAFYPAVGPLLGLFIAAVLVFLVATFVLVKVNKFTAKFSESASFWVYVVSVLLFFLMVFPPIFEPIAEIIAGK